MGAAAVGRRVTHRLDKQVSHLLLGMPGLHTVPHLLQELLMVFQQLGDLVKDLIDKRWVTQQGVLWLLQRLHVPLRGPWGQRRSPWRDGTPTHRHVCTHESPRPTAQWPCLLASPVRLRVLGRRWEDLSLCPLLQSPGPGTRWGEGNWERLVDV